MNGQLPDRVVRRMDGNFYIELDNGVLSSPIVCEAYLGEGLECNNLAIVYDDIDDAFYCYYCSEGLQDERI